MLLFFQQVLNGLTLGGIYSLVALGLTLVYGILQVPNFAHGAFYMVGAYIAYQVSTVLGYSYFVGMAASIIVVAALASLSERLIFRPLQGTSGLHPMIAAIGLLLFLQAVAQAIWGADFLRLSSPFTEVIQIGGVMAASQRLVIIVAAFSLMLALHLFLTRTTLGSTIVAMSQDKEGAELVGIEPRRIALLTFAISGGLAAVAGVLYAPINLIYPAMGQIVIMKAFVIIILGGMGSVPGAIIGGIIIGMAEAMGDFYISSNYKDMTAFLALVLILSWRPEGLFKQGGSA